MKRNLSIKKEILELFMPPNGVNKDFIKYLVSERKLGFFVQIKEDENFNHRNTLSISRIKI
jgi:hypothetical protein